MERVGGMAAEARACTTCKPRCSLWTEVHRNRFTRTRDTLWNPRWHGYAESKFLRERRLAIFWADERPMARYRGTL